MKTSRASGPSRRSRIVEAGRAGAAVRGFSEVGFGVGLGKQVLIDSRPRRVVSKTKGGTRFGALPDRDPWARRARVPR